MMQRKAFTLIELLVVIAVMMALMALLLPTFVEARHQSRGTVCLSHLRQLAAAQLLYADDYAEQFPLAFYRVEGTGCLRTVYGMLKPYLKNEAILVCPANPQPTDLTAVRSAPPIVTPLCGDEPHLVSLMPNWCLLVNTFTYPNVGSVSLADIPFPAETGAWFDGDLLSADGTRFEPYSLIAPVHGHLSRVPAQVVAGHEGRYHGRVQASFVDGHAKSYPARLLPDARRVGGLFQMVARMTTIDGRMPPYWVIQGHRVYAGRYSFYGWPSRVSPNDPTRMFLRCYARSNYCDEWR